MSRKALTTTLVAATIAWSIGLSMLLAPMAAKAAPASGTLIKGSLAAVYYVGADGKRYVFPNEKTYKTWYPDFSGVVIITDAELASLAIGGNVTYRPGVKLVKIQTDPKTYAVTKNGTLRWVTSEALATSLYGSDWNTADTHDVPDAFFTNYTVGADITNASQYDPAAETAAATSINQDKSLTGPGAVTGSLTASLAAGQPAGGTVPAGATGVNVLKLDVRNNSSAALTVDSLTVHRMGAGAAADIKSVYVYEGNNRLTTGRTINSSTHEAAFSGLNLELSAGLTRTLWIAVDFDCVAVACGGNTHQFEVTKVMSGTLNASGLPLAGPSWTMSTAKVGSMEIKKSGTITNPKAGQLQAKVAEFQLVAGSEEDLRLNRVSLFHSGSISRGYLTNLTLKQAGLTLATAAALNNKDQAVFALSSPMFMEKGNTRTFEVFADVSGAARAGDTVKFYLEETTDLNATGVTYGFGVRVTNPTYDGGACTTAAGDCSFSVVDAGQLTITFNGPAAKDIPTNGKDIEVYNFTMAAQANLEVRKLSFKLDTTGGNLDNDTTAFYTDVKVTDTASGVTVSGPKDVPVVAGANTTATLDFTEVFNLTANQARTFKVTLDVASNTTADETIKLTLNAFGASDVRNLDNGQFLTGAEIVPNAAIAGNTHKVKVPSLTLSLASTPVSQTYIQGASGAQLLGISLKAGDAADVKVSSLKVSGYIDAGDTGEPDFGAGTDADTGDTTAVLANDVLTVKLWNGTTQLSSTKSPNAADGTATFDNLDLTVTKGQTLTLTLTGNLASSIAGLSGGGENPDRVAFNVAAAADVNATDPEGNAVGATGFNFNPLAGPGRIMTIKAAGTITVAKAPDDAESEAGLVIGGGSNVVLAKYTLSATDEELKLTKARLTVTAPATTTSLSLYDGSTLVGGPTSPDGGGVADFSNVNFVIPKDGSKVLTVKANLSTVGSSGAASGSNAKVTLSSTVNFEARGTSAGSNTQLTTFAGGDLAGNDKIARRTKPTVTLVALPNTALATGDNTIMRFTVQADAASQVSLKKLTVKLSMSLPAATVTTTTTGSSMRRVNDTNLPGVAAFVGGCAAASTTCTLEIDIDNEEALLAGSSRTYDVVVNIGTQAPLVTGNSISSNLEADVAAVATETGWLSLNGGARPRWTIDTTNTSTADGTLRNFIWSDNSGAPHAADPTNNDPGTALFDSSKDWANSGLLKLPSNTQTVSK